MNELFKESETLEFLFEFLIEIIMEPIVECYIFLMTHFSDKSKKPNKEKAVYIVLAESITLLLMFVIGVVMLLETDGESLVGKILLSFSVVISIIQISLCLLLRKKVKSKK